MPTHQPGPNMILQSRILTDHFLFLGCDLVYISDLINKWLGLAFLLFDPTAQPVPDSIYNDQQPQPDGFRLTHWTSRLS